MGNTLNYDSGRLPLGNVGRAHATRGEVSFRAFNEDSRTLCDIPRPFQVALEDAAGKTQLVQVTSVRFVKDHFLLAIEGITDRDTAGALTGRVLWIDRSLMPPMAPGEFYWQDLIGCNVFDQLGRPLGKMQSVFNNKAHGVGAILSDAGVETLVPLVPAFLLTIDIPSRRLVVDVLPEEDLNDAHLQKPE